MNDMSLEEHRSVDEGATTNFGVDYTDPIVIHGDARYELCTFHNVVFTIQAAANVSFVRCVVGDGTVAATADATIVFMECVCSESVIHAIRGATQIALSMHSCNLALEGDRVARALPDAHYDALHALFFEPYRYAKPLFAALRTPALPIHSVLLNLLRHREWDLAVETLVLFADSHRSILQELYADALYQRALFALLLHDQFTVALQVGKLFAALPPDADAFRAYLDGMQRDGTPGVIRAIRTQNALALVYNPARSYIDDRLVASVLEREHDQELVLETLDLVGRLNAPALNDSLIACLMRSYKPIQLQCLVTIGLLDDPPGVEQYASFLGAPDSEVREQTYETLQSVGALDHPAVVAAMRIGGDAQ